MSGFLTLIMAIAIAMIIVSILPYIFIGVLWIGIVIVNGIVSGYNYIIRKLYD